MSKGLSFSTHISGNTSKGFSLRGKLLLDLVKKHTYTEVLYLSLTGSLPTESERIVLDAILVSAIDHGLEPSSGFVPRVAAASGNPVLPSMATSLLALGPLHGGAITDAMLIFNEISAKDDIEQASRNVVVEARTQKRRIPGFGHPHYKDEDPRAAQLLTIARQQKIPELPINVARTLETTLEDVLGKKLVLNIDGAIAAILCSLKISPLAGNGIFGLARVGGSIAHIVEEKTEDTAVRRLEAGSVEYIP